MKKILFVIGKIGNGGVSKTLCNLISDKRSEGYEISVLRLLEEKSSDKIFNDKIKEIEVVIPKYVMLELNRGYKRAAITCIQDYKFGIAIKILYYNCKAKLQPKKSDMIIAKHILKDIPSVNETYDIAIDYLGYQSIITAYVIDKINAITKYTYIHFDCNTQRIDPLKFIDYYDEYNKIIAVSEKSRKYFMDNATVINKDKFEVCYNIVPKLEVIKMANSSKTELEDVKEVKLLTIGRLADEKGLDIAISVCKKLLVNGYDIKWYVCGEGKERPNLENMIDKYELKNNFILLGNKENPYSYLRSCDIYVQTSKSEGYSTTLTEAICLNKPIVTTNIGGSEQIENNETGLIVKIDENEIYKAIKNMIDDEELRDKFIRNIKSKDSKVRQDIWEYIKSTNKEKAY